MEKESLLIIDSEIFILKKAQNILNEERLSIETASNLDEARKILSSSNLRLIIFSPSAIGGKFEEFMQEINNFEHLNDLQFMVLLNEDEVSDAVNLLKMGISDYVIKPFRPKELTYRVLTTLSRAKEPMDISPQASFKWDLEDISLIELIKICEINNFNGALRIKDKENEYLIELRLGNITSINAPKIKKNEIWDKVLLLTKGTLDIEQEPPSFWRAKKSNLEPIKDISSKLPAAFAKEPPGSSAAITESKRLPMGRISSLKMDDKQFQIQTEVHTGKNPTITTLIICEGQIHKKIERRWSPADEVADKVSKEQDMINEHHDSIVASLQKLWPLTSKLSELIGEILLKAVKLIVRFGRRVIGRNISTYYLKTLQASFGKKFPELSAFDIDEEGKISFSSFDKSKESSIKTGVYQWLSEFVDKCCELSPLIKANDIRELTKPLEFQLEWIDFYAPEKKK